MSNPSQCASNPSKSSVFAPFALNAVRFRFLTGVSVFSVSLGLLSCSRNPGGANTPPSSSGGSSAAARGGAEQPSSDTRWREGLGDGPNGPIPLIVVDQFGYRPNDAKVALIRDPRTGYDASVDFAPGSRYALIDARSGASLKQGAPQSWNGGAVDPKSGDVVWTFDFSDVTSPGTYYVLDEERARRSPEFVIDAGVYRNVLRHALRTFYYQRAGYAKLAAFAGAEWADDKSHLGKDQDSETHAWLDKGNDAKVKDLRGGWYDAGDYNKYTNWHARYIITLLRTFADSPSAFGDDSGIPESGNGTPDLLDEVKFGLDWLVRMQNADGSVLCVQGLGHASPPSSAKDPSFYGPATTAATLSAAAAFAYAARTFSARSEPALQRASRDYQARALKAWTFANANPRLTYFNNDNGKQPGSGGLASGQQEVDDANRLALKVEAAAYLFERTGDDSYRDFFDQNYAATWSEGITHWLIDRHEALLDYTKLAKATPAVVAAIRAKYLDAIKSGSGKLPAIAAGADAYRTPIDAYTWGSSQSKAAAGRLLLLLDVYGLDSASAPLARNAAADYLHYLHGANPLGLVYLTNMQRAGAEHSAKTLYHSWFSYKNSKWSEVTRSTPGPPPGFLVGGPNPSFALDNCCNDGSRCYGAADFSFCALNWTPPLGQPDAKSYKQFNHGWPANSWAVTENSNGYQVQYVRLLAGFVK